jgi:hypothetical protein
LEWHSRIAVHVNVSNNDRSKKRRFNLPELQAQAFAMSDALGPNSQATGDDDRSETDRDQNRDEQARGENEEKALSTHGRSMLSRKIAERKGGSSPAVAGSRDASF